VRRFFRVDRERSRPPALPEAWSKHGPRSTLYERSRKLGTSGRRAGRTGLAVGRAAVGRDVAGTRACGSSRSASKGDATAQSVSREFRRQMIGVLAFNSARSARPRAPEPAIHSDRRADRTVLQRKQAEKCCAKARALPQLTELSSDWYWEQDENFRFHDGFRNLHRRSGR